MPNYSHATIIGHIGRDPETRFLPDGKPVCQFSVATTKKMKGADTTTWWRVSAFGRTAEIAQQYLAKGSPVLVAGEPVLREYQAKDGTTKSSLELTADRLTLLGGRDSGGDTTQERPAQTSQSRAPQRAKDAGLPADADDLSDIPF